MKRQLRSFLQIALLFAVAFLLLRLFPVAVRATEAAALGAWQLWWAILGLALAIWLFWVLRKRNEG